MNAELDSLNQACKILSVARFEACSDASTKPYLMLEHARQYLAKQADDLVAPVFDPDTCKHGKRWSDCEPCRGWTERARLVHVYGPENI